MKLKNKYVLRDVADKTVAIAIEKGNEKTDGVITLNSTGALIFSLINEGCSYDELCAKFFDEYEVTKEGAKEAVDSFLETLSNAGLLEE